MTTDFLTVLTTTDSREAAEALARSAVAARLAACAQVDGPVTSTYWWQGKLESAQEWRVLCKTTAGRYPELEEHIRANHSYDTPEVIATPIASGSAGYLAWVASEVG